MGTIQKRKRRELESSCIPARESFRRRTRYETITNRAYFSQQPTAGDYVEKFYDQIYGVGT